MASKQMITRCANAMRKFAEASGGGEVVETATKSGTQLRLNMPVGEGMSVILEFHGDGKNPWCETVYSAKGKSFTYNRVGVDDSFYFESVAKLPEQLAEQLERVKKSQERLKDTREFSFGPTSRMMSEQQIKDMVALLKTGKTYTVTPAGFGTGYVFTIRFHPDHRRYYSNLKASYELERLVGQRVFISTIDCD